MSIKNLTIRTVLAFAILDALFNPLVIAAYVQLLGVGATRTSILILVGCVLLKMLVCSLYIRAQLRDFEALASTRVLAQSAELVIRADDRLQGSVTRVGLFYALSWSLAYGLGFGLMQLMNRGDMQFNSGAWQVVALVMLAVGFGGLAFGMPLIAVLTATASGECSGRARQLGIALPRPAESLQIRIGVIALALGLGPTLWTMALGYTKQIDAQENHNGTQAELLAARLSDKFVPGSTPNTLSRLIEEVRGNTQGAELILLTHRGSSLIPDADGEPYSPPYAPRIVISSKSSPTGTLRQADSPERIAYRKLGDGTIAVAQVNLPSNTVSSFVFSAGLFALVVAVWAPICAFILGRAVTIPLERLIATTEKIVEEGKQSEIASLPVVRNDEVGRLSDRFNDLLDMMRDLSRAADSIASGELRVEITRQGELPDAFRRMLDSLRAMVREIRSTSVDLASAATEILAASQEQESAATSQSSAMEEISRTMESLSASAAHVSDSVQGVLANAEQTLSTTDQMVARITELSGHANRIGEILDVIRDIADRSDLLALNGSLEASRAADGGHGFALVAAEMRRLAERVTASVEDVKGLVGDIRDSGSSTVVATEEGRRLADGTTEAARQITFVTQQQRSGTEQVSESIRNITDVVTQAVSATAQTRSSAQSLKTQADRLAALVKRFELEPGEAA